MMDIVNQSLPIYKTVVSVCNFKLTLNAYLSTYITQTIPVVHIVLI